jgi:hypothetical protein
MRPYERVCFDAWRATLPSHGAYILDKQIHYLKAVHRYSRGKLLVFFPAHNLAVPEEFLFPNRSNECVCAHVQVVLESDTSRRINARIILHEGRLSSIEFRQSPEDSGFKADSQVKVVEVKVHIDPMEDTAAQPRKSYPKFWTGSLARWSLLGEVRPWAPPLEDASRVKILSSLGVKLPEDYLDVVAQVEGAQIGRVRILGVTEIRHIVLPKQNLCVLAEVEGSGVLCVDELRDSAQLLFLANDENHPEPRAGTLCAVIESILQENDPESRSQRGMS